jgi:hypothetical protein
MKRHIFGTRAGFLLSGILMVALVRSAFPAPGLADAGKVGPYLRHSFCFGEGFRGNPAMIGEALDRPWPGWLIQRYIPVSGRQYDLPFCYPRGPEENLIQRFVHNSMQSFFVACGVYALVGGLGSRLTDQMDDAAENAFWQAIESTAKRRDEGKNPRGPNFRGY